MDTKRPPDIAKADLKFPTRDTSSLQQPRFFRWILIGLIITLILILAGLVGWLLTMQQEPTVTQPTATRPTAEENNEPESSTAEAAVVTQQALSPSTELRSIETDLESTTIIELDPMFADIEAMF